MEDQWRISGGSGGTPGDGMILRIARTAALWGIALLVAASTLTAFAESYRALCLWGVRQDVAAGWALVWPAMVDVFIAVGELALFVALADRWAVRSRLFAWSVTLAGLAVSVAANVGHVAGHSLTARATAAVPPLAAAAPLAAGLGALTPPPPPPTTTPPPPTPP